jgi:TIR domain
MPQIFLSYRRDDSAGHTGRIFDHLSGRFGSGCVFMDVEGIEAGENFAEAIEASIARCDTVVAVIGKHWAADASGKKRIEDPDDYVRREIETALRLGVELVPLLVGGAKFPARQELPVSLAELSLRNALEIDDRAFLGGVQRLIDVLERTTARSGERRRLEKLGELARKKSEQGGGMTSGRQWWTRLRRLLLFYAPAHRAMWVLHVIFYYVLFCAVVVPLATIGEMGREAAVPFTIFAGLAAMLRAIAVVTEPSQTSSRVRRWWLLYKPPRAGTALLHILFLLVLSSSLLWAPTVLLTLPDDTPFGRAMVAEVVVFWAALTFAIRDVAAARDPLRPRGSERNWFARLLYLWPPRRRRTWLPRAIFYLSAFSLIIMAPQIFAGEDRSLHWSWISQNRGDLTQALLYFVIAVTARGWARGTELWHSLPPSVRRVGGIRRLLLFDPPSRAAGWAPRLLLWSSLALIAGLIVRRSWLLSALGWGLGAFSWTYLGGLAALVAVGAQQWSLVYPGRTDVG